MLYKLSLLACDDGLAQSRFSSNSRGDYSEMNGLRSDLVDYEVGFSKGSAFYDLFKLVHREKPFLVKGILVLVSGWLSL